MVEDALRSIRQYDADATRRYSATFYLTSDSIGSSLLSEDANECLPGSHAATARGRFLSEYVP